MLRGYFDGGGLRKQNGHWQSSGAGIIPPSPTVILTQGIIDIMSAAFINHGNMFMYDNAGKPHFKPIVNPDGGNIISDLDLNINTGGGEVNNSSLSYSGANYYSKMLYDIDHSISQEGDFEKIIVRLEPYDATGLLNEYEQNLVIPDLKEPASIYNALPQARIYFCNDSMDISANVFPNAGTWLPSNTTNSPAIYGITPAQNDGVKIGSGISFERANAYHAFSWFSVNFFQLSFSFDYDFIPSNALNEPLKLTYKVIGVNR